MSQDSPRRWEALLAHLPVLDWARSCRWSCVRSDLVAGLATSTLVIPQAMAYAALAGLPLQSGLYVAMVPALAYAVLGTSRPLSVSTTAMLSILTAGGVAAAGGDSTRALGAAAALAVIAGLGLLLAGVLRLGFLADFIASPVLTGFRAGLGLVIIASQLGRVLGLQVSGVTFFGPVWAALRQLGATNLPTLALTLASLAVLVALARLAPRVSGPLVVVVLGIVAVRFWALDHHGVSLVPGVPPGLPGFALPDFHRAGALVPAAAGVALVSFVESVAAARASAATDDRKIDANQELLALGVANLAGGLFQAFPAGGGRSQTRFSRESGVRTQLAQVVAAGVVIVVLLALTPLLAGLPEATLGAILLLAGARLVDFGALRRIRSLQRPAFWQAITALAAVLALGVLQGLLVALMISVLILLQALDQPPIEVLGRERGSGRWRPRDHHPQAAAISGILVVRPAGGLFFANARRVADRLLAVVDAADPLPEVLLVDASLVPDVEATALEALEQLDADLRERGVRLWLAGLTWRVERVADRFGLCSRWGGDRFFATLDDAVAHFLGRL